MPTSGDEQLPEQPAPEKSANDVVRWVAAALFGCGAVALIGGAVSWLGGAMCENECPSDAAMTVRLVMAVAGGVAVIASIVLAIVAAIDRSLNGP